MANSERTYIPVSLPKEFYEEVQTDADKLTKEQRRLKPVSLAEMIMIRYRAAKQRAK